MVQLIRKAVNRELGTSTLTLMLVFLALMSLFRILEIAIDPESYLNIVSPVARESLLWLVIIVAPCL